MQQLRFVILFILLAAPAYAGSVTIAWDASPSVGVTGYRVYVGTAPGVYNPPISVGNVLQATVTGLAPGTWYLTCTAVDAEGNESDFATSMEDPTKQYVSATIPDSNLCDLNGDGSVNVLDLQLIRNHILSGSPLGDLNKDGSTNVLDLQLLTNIIMGRANCPN